MNPQRVAIGALLAIVALLCVIAMQGCGGSRASLKETCQRISHRGQQCEALQRVQWAEQHGIPPETVEGYHSLPED